MAKLAPRDLAQVLGKLPKQNFSSDVLVGFETSDDAGVFRVNEELALVQTIDFFTPVADEPGIYGRIAAINSLNDIYAMGGTPISALSIVCYPQKGDWEILGEIMLGGQKALNEEKVVVLGGHSVDDGEIKFGYAITGTINPAKIIKNSGAKAGDTLILTKPIGTGVISTGIKFGKADENSKQAALKTMTTSARNASEVMRKLEANGCTDITGFGLLGHAYEMAKASNVTFNIKSETVPLLPNVLNLIEKKMLTRGDKNNREYVGATVKFEKSVMKEMQSALFDPQTAGGLLISLEEDKAEEFLKNVEGSVIIGTVKTYDNILIEIE
ncbi:MAG TPA: selenide, water dikinase SelD [Pyrinomonadaceae bacterium]|nr:selenide, water dikinase SelD [Pyrinomonadaceae bacterium]